MKKTTIADEGQLQQQRISASNSNNNVEAKKSICILAAIFVASVSAMFYVYMIFPELKEYV